MVFFKFYSIRSAQAKDIFFNGRNVLCAAVQISFTEFRGKQNVHRLKLRHSCLSQVIDFRDQMRSDTI